MNCSEFEILLCDYVDGTLDAARKQALEAHQRGCAACAEFARDVTGAVAFMERAEDVTVPAELLTKIAFHIPESVGRTVQTGGLRALFSKWLQPVFQPRFAMGMAMTILSFSMVARFAG
ncbi:MAG: zf-HC2 domain-containing protein, partial [Bryobacteraceae bacterium]